MKRFIKNCTAGLLAVGFISTSVFASVDNSIEYYANEGNVIASGGYINYDDIDVHTERLFWTTESISTGNLRGTWRHRLLSNAVESEVSGTNAEGQAIARNSFTSDIAPWANAGTWSRAMVARTETGNRSGWDLR